MVPPKVAGGYIEPSQIHTNVPKWLKHGLKWSLEDPLDDPFMSSDNFFQVRVAGVLNFFLSFKNGTPKSHGRVYWAVSNPYPCSISKKAQIWLKMIPRKYSWQSKMFSDNFFFSQLGCRGPQFLLIGQKSSREGAGRVYWAFPNPY